MYIPRKQISTHPRYQGSGVFGSIGKVLGKVLGNVSSKVTKDAVKKIATKAVSKVGEQAGEAVLKKTQAIADQKAG